LKHWPYRFWQNTQHNASYPTLAVHNATQAAAVTTKKKKPS